MSFWDTSAIVPLFINEDRSQLARRLWRQFSQRNVWRESSVEVASTIARLAREGVLNEPLRTKTEERFSWIEKEWTIIDPTEKLIGLARMFPSLYGLKSLDSLQLASALIWCKENPKNKDFVCGDGKLLKAAEAAGFTIHDLT